MTICLRTSNWDSSSHPSTIWQNFLRASIQIENKCAVGTISESVRNPFLWRKRHGSRMEGRKIVCKCWFSEFWLLKTLYSWLQHSWKWILHFRSAFLQFLIRILAFPLFLSKFCLFPAESSTFESNFGFFTVPGVFWRTFCYFSAFFGENFSVRVNSSVIEAKFCLYPALFKVNFGFFAVSEIF